MDIKQQWRLTALHCVSCELWVSNTFQIPARNLVFKKPLVDSRTREKQKDSNVIHVCSCTFRNRKTKKAKKKKIKQKTTPLIPVPTPKRKHVNDKDI